MRLVCAALLALLVLIQYPLWLGKGGWRAVWAGERQNAQARAANAMLAARNAALAAEVQDLQSGSEAIEERARGELGLMRNNEIFVQIIPAPALPSPR